MPELDLKAVNEAVEGIKTAFEDFKKTQDQRLAEIAEKGKADPILDEKLQKIEDAITEHQKRIDEYEVSQKRTSKTYVDDAGNPVDLDAKALEWAKKAARERDEQVDEFGHDDLMNYKSVFLKFAAKATEHLTPDEQKALSVGSNPDGGYFVPPDMSNIIAKKVFETSPVRQYAQVYVTGRDVVEGIYDDNEVGFGWVGETGSRSETTTPEVGKWSIPVFEAYAHPRATQRVLDDADMNIEAWLTQKIADRLARAENASFVTGDGVNQPRGFTTYTAGTSVREQVEQISTGVNGAFAATPDGGDTLLTAIYSLKAAYRQRAVFFMNRKTLAEVRKLKDSNGNYIWAPGAQAGQPSMLFGYPVADFEDMADIATGSLSIAVGDLSNAYMIVERQGIRVLRDPYTAKPYVTFYATKRVGGGLINGEALKLIKFAA